MKLIFCPSCQDVVKLQLRTRKCLCGKAWGNYSEDGLNAEIGGRAIPIGFDNPAFEKAIRERPELGKGKEFSAFVIPKKCKTIKPV